MLTITRKVGEEVWTTIGLRVVVKEIRRNQVRLGIIAPMDIGVHRPEVLGPSTKNPLKAYRTLQKCLGVARDMQDAKWEEEVLDAMDVVWRLLGPADIAEIDDGGPDQTDGSPGGCKKNEGE